MLLSFSVCTAGKQPKLLWMTVSEKGFSDESVAAAPRKSIHNKWLTNPNQKYTDYTGRNNTVEVRLGVLTPGYISFYHSTMSVISLEEINVFRPVIFGHQTVVTETS